jgi:hypothetical protein
MRRLRELNQYRDRQWERALGADGDDTGGCFKVPSPFDRQPLAVMAATGEGWDHVSISRSNRTPSWGEMDHIKRLFFSDDEVAFQLHVTTKDHISVHPFCLHIWRPHDEKIPLPPKWR